MVGVFLRPMRSAHRSSERLAIEHPVESAMRGRQLNGRKKGWVRSSSRCPRPPLRARRRGSGVWGPLSLAPGRSRALHTTVSPDRGPSRFSARVGACNPAPPSGRNAMLPPRPRPRPPVSATTSSKDASAGAPAGRCDRLRRACDEEKRPPPPAASRTMAASSDPSRSASPRAASPSRSDAAPSADFPPGFCAAAVERFQEGLKVSQSPRRPRRSHSATFPRPFANRLVLTMAAEAARGDRVAGELPANHRVTRW